MELNIVIQKSELLVFGVFFFPLFGVYGFFWGGWLKRNAVKTVHSFCFAGDWFKTDFYVSKC